MEDNKANDSTRVDRFHFHKSQEKKQNIGEIRYHLQSFVVHV